MAETAYDHIDGRETFTVTAAERWSIGMVRRLKEQRPDEVEIVAENEDGSIVAHMPARWMKIKPTKRMNITPERRAELADRLRAAKSK